LPNTIPEPPGHLSDESKALWRDINADYDLEAHEFKLLRLACEALDRANQARRALRRHGLTFVDFRGKPVARPEVAIERDSRTAFARLMAQLNLPMDDDETTVQGRPIRDRRTGRYAPRPQQKRSHG